MKKELLNKVLEEARKLDGVAAAYFVPKEGTEEISHCEIRLPNEEGKFNRGFILHKVLDKVHNGELFDEKIRGLLTHTFANEKMAVIKRTVALKDFDTKVEIRPTAKKVKYVVNGNVVFTLRKVRMEDETFSVSSASLNKAAIVVEEELSKLLKTTPNDFRVCKDLIEAVVNYLVS